jgi:hypothetical protein
MKSMRRFEQLAYSLETSEEIIEAIAEIMGDQTNSILGLWNDPDDHGAEIIARARRWQKDPTEPLVWGVGGEVN